MDLRILVVEDSETTRRMIRAILQSRRWTVCGEAENGWTGIDKFRTLKPDVVILDLAMPGMNGIQVANLMSRLNPRVPLVLFTLLDLEHLTEAAFKAGIHDLVSKTQALDLITAIESAIAHRRPVGSISTAQRSISGKL